MRYLNELIETESGMVVARVWGEGGERELFNDLGVLIREVEKSSGDEWW